MKSPYDVVIRPVISEKSMGLVADKCYAFEVDSRANKTEIRQAVEKIFGVNVKNVRTVHTIGKIKRQGRTQGRTPAVTKAYVTLTKDSNGIEFFDSMSQ